MFSIQMLSIHKAPCSELHSCTSTPYLQTQPTLEDTGGTKETTVTHTLSLSRTHARIHTHTHAHTHARLTQKYSPRHPFEGAVWLRHIRTVCSDYSHILAPWTQKSLSGCVNEPDLRIFKALFPGLTRLIFTWGEDGSVTFFWPISPKTGLI